MPSLENQFACLANLPSMPALLMEALQQVNSEQDLAILANKISQDPSMVIRILRIANSPFYGMSREVGSLREAILLIGFNRLRDMLISACFPKILPTWHKDFNYRSFWRHSMAVAECTRQLASYTGNCSELAFTAGLLHDIGILVIVLLFPNEFSQFLKEPGYPSVEIERRILGFDNVELGSQAALHWKLPIAIQEAIEQHETPLEPGGAVSLGRLVHTANLLITKTEQSAESALEEYEPIRIALATLHVSMEQAKHCIDRGQQFADQIVALF